MVSIGLALKKYVSNEKKTACYQRPLSVMKIQDAISLVYPKRVHQYYGLLTHKNTTFTLMSKVCMNWYLPANKI